MEVGKGSSVDKKFWVQNWITPKPATAMANRNGPMNKILFIIPFFFQPQLQWNAILVGITF